MIEPLSTPKPAPKALDVRLFDAKVMQVRYKLAFQQVYKTSLPYLQEIIRNKTDCYVFQQFGRNVAALAESDAPLTLGYADIVDVKKSKDSETTI